MAARGGFERFKHNPAGYRAILKSPALQAVCHAKGERIAATVRSRLPERLRDWDVIVDTRAGANRARTIVSGVPIKIEQDEAILGSAIDAARG